MGYSKLEGDIKHQKAQKNFEFPFRLELTTARVLDWMLLNHWASEGSMVSKVEIEFYIPSLK